MDAMLDEMVTAQRVYINTYTQKVSGDDTRFTVDLGRDYQFRELSLDCAVIEQKMLPFYRSQQRDFRMFDFTVDYGGGAETVRLQCTKAVDRDTFAAWFNAAQDAIVITDDPLPAPEFRLRYAVADTIGTLPMRLDLIGAGWGKIGYRLGEYRPQIDAAGPASFRIEARSIFDFAAPPMILINMMPVVGAGMISNGHGMATWAIPNTVPFGERITFVSTQRTTCNTIYSHQRQSIRFLEISLLSCDQMPLETPADADGVVNRNDLEIIMVLSLR